MEGMVRFWKLLYWEDGKVRCCWMKTDVCRCQRRTCFNIYGLHQKNGTLTATSASDWLFDPTYGKYVSLRKWQCICALFGFVGADRGAAKCFLFGTTEPPHVAVQLRSLRTRFFRQLLRNAVYATIFFLPTLSNLADHPPLTAKIAQLLEVHRCCEVGAIISLNLLS